MTQLSLCQELIGDFFPIKEGDEWVYRKTKIHKHNSGYIAKDSVTNSLLSYKIQQVNKNGDSTFFNLLINGAVTGAISHIKRINRKSSNVPKPQRVALPSSSKSKTCKRFHTSRRFFFAHQDREEKRACRKDKVGTGDA